MQSTCGVTATVSRSDTPPHKYTSLCTASGGHQQSGMLIGSELQVWWCVFWHLWVKQNGNLFFFLPKWKLFSCLPWKKNPTCWEVAISHSCWNDTGYSGTFCSSGILQGNKLPCTSNQKVLRNDPIKLYINFYSCSSYMDSPPLTPPKKP